MPLTTISKLQQEEDKKVIPEYIPRAVREADLDRKAREEEKQRQYEKHRKETIREHMMSTPRGRETLEMEEKAKKKAARDAKKPLTDKKKLPGTYFHKDLGITEQERKNLLMIQEYRSQQENLKREAEEIERQKKALGITFSAYEE